MVLMKTGGKLRMLSASGLLFKWCPFQTTEKQAFLACLDTQSEHKIYFFSSAQGTDHLNNKLAQIMQQ